MLFIAFIVSFIAFHKKKGCENPSNDDIQGVMMWLDGCGGLWQMRLNLGQCFVKLLWKCSDCCAIYPSVFSLEGCCDVN